MKKIIAFIISAICILSFAGCSGNTQPKDVDLNTVLTDPEFGCTTSELTMEQKNKISHRGKALTHMREELMKRGLFG